MTAMDFDDAELRYLQVAGARAPHPARTASYSVAGTWHLANNLERLATVDRHGDVTLVPGIRAGGARV